MKILVIDDNYGDVLLLKEVFECNNVVVDDVGNGKLGLDYLEANPPPNMIIVDLNMPSMCGHEFLQKLPKKHTKIPVVVLTSSETHEDVTKSYELNANAHVVKTSNAVEAIGDIKRFFMISARIP